MTQDSFYDSQSAYGTQSPGEPPKKNNTLKIVLIVLVVLVLCCCLTLVAGWFLGDPILELLSNQGVDLGLSLLRLW